MQSNAPGRHWSYNSDLDRPSLCSLTAHYCWARVESGSLHSLADTFLSGRGRGLLAAPNMASLLLSGGESPEALPAFSDSTTSGRGRRPCYCQVGGVQTPQGSPPVLWRGMRGVCVSLPLGGDKNPSLSTYPSLSHLSRYAGHPGTA